MSKETDNQNNPMYDGEKSDGKKRSQSMVQAYRAQLEKNAEFDAPALVDGMVDFVSIVVISSKDREAKYTKFMKIFVLVGLAYFGWKSYDTLFNSDPTTSSEMLVMEGMKEVLPHMVLCHETVSTSVEDVQCRFYDYFDEASEFPTCENAEYGCMDVPFDYVDIDVDRTTPSGTVTSLSQRCLFVDMKKNGISFTDTTHALRCHGTLVDAGSRRMALAENEEEEEEAEEELTLESLAKEVKKLKKQIKEMNAGVGGRKLDASFTYQPNMMVISLYDGVAYSMEEGMKISNSLIDDTMSLVSWSTLYYNDDTGRDSSLEHHLFDTKTTTVGHGHAENEFSVMLRPATFVQTNIYVSYESLMDYLNDIGGCIGLVELVLALVAVVAWLMANIQLRALGGASDEEGQEGDMEMQPKTV